MPSPRSPHREPAGPARRRWSRRRTLGLVGGGLLTALAGTGCTWLDARSNDRVTVTIGNQAELDPATLTVSTGTTVVWENLSTNRHAVTTDTGLAADAEAIVVPEGAEPWDSGDLTSGMTWEYRFDTPGTWVYVDRYGGHGLVGVITVEDG